MNDFQELLVKRFAFYTFVRDFLAKNPRSIRRSRFRMLFWMSSSNTSRSEAFKSPKRISRTTATT